MSCNINEINDFRNCFSNIAILFSWLYTRRRNICKIFNLEDLRTIGSGNTGTTNVLRTGNYAAAALTLTFDFGKACLTVYFTLLFIGKNLIFISGVVTLIGHIFPVWLRFKGGKGFASYLGIISIMNIYLFLLISLVWLIVFLL